MSNTQVPENEAIKTLDDLLGQLNTVESRLKQAELNKDEEIKAIVAKYAPQVDAHTTLRDELVERIAAIYQQHRTFLTEGKGKMVVLRSGTLSARLSALSIDIIDENAAMKFLRRVGKLRKYTKVGKRTIVKNELKKDPEFARTVPGITLDQGENLTIKLPKVGVERVRRLLPLRATLSSDKS